MAKTIFEKIVAREIPAKIEFEDDRCIVIHDIEPQAPVHLLVVPKKVIQRVGELVEADAPIVGHLLVVAAQVAKKMGLDRGFRIVINSGPDACESVPHLHVHVLAKRQMSWPPG
jgi:histidine triad (HIT) family protein